MPWFEIQFPFDGGGSTLVFLVGGVGQDDTVIRRMGDAMSRKGTLIVLRSTTQTGAGPNPPVLIAPRLDGSVSAGATQIAIRASQATGRILAGDQIRIGTSALYTVASAVTARAPSVDPTVVVAPGFTSITLTTPLANNASDDATITPAWAADQGVYGAVGRNSLSLAGDQRIDGDFVLTIPALGVLRIPRPQDAVAFAGTWHRITQVNPVLARDKVVCWTVGAR